MIRDADGPAIVTGDAGGPAAVALASTPRGVV